MPDGGWSARERAIALLIGVWFALQVTVPAIALLGDPPARFSWQMFAGLSGHPTLVLVRDDGTEEERSFGQVLERVRADVRYDEILPPYLCSREDDLVAVVVVRDDVRAVHECA